MKNDIKIWKALPGVPGVEISTLGKVRTLDRVISSESRTYFTEGKVLTGFRITINVIGVPLNEEFTRTRNYWRKTND